MRTKPVTKIDDPRYVKALSHPLRVRILALLQERQASPRELAEWLGATLGTVSYHVRALHELGLIELVKTTQVRGAIAHHYKARVRPRISEEAWATATPVVKQASVGAALQTMDDYARASAAAGGFDRAEAHLSRTMLQLDDRGWQAAARAFARLTAELEKIEEAAGKRLAKDAAGSSEAAVALLMFEPVKLAADEPHTNNNSGTKTARKRASKASADRRLEG